MGKNVRPYCGQTDPSGTCDYVYRAFPATIWLFLLFAAKEIYMGLMGLFVIRKKNQILVPSGLEKLVRQAWILEF